MTLKKVGVVGCGLMGSGIAQVCAQIGCDVLVTETSQELLKRGIGRIEKFLDDGIKRGKVTEEKKKEVLGRIRGTTDMSEFKDREIVIEAVIENMEAKKEVFRRLDEIVQPNAILATNTSSLSVTEIATATRRPGKVIGMHFFNPVPIMKLVEIVRPETTDEETLNAVRELGKALGKDVITAKDNPGFIVNLLLVPYLLDAVRAVEHGVATPEDIDAGMKIGCGHPMGPIRLLDYVGLDTTLYIADFMFSEYKDTRYAAPPLLRRMVTAGRNGRKAGRGFYDWSKK